MAHILRLLCRGYFVQRHHLVSASSRRFAHTLAESCVPAAESDSSNEFVSTISSLDAQFAEEFDNNNVHAASISSSKDWSRDYQLDKVMTRHLDSAVLGVRRLFDLVKQNKLEEMLVVHDELAEKEKETLHTSMDVVMYSRLMTRIRELRPHYVLPVFQRMLSIGVVPNVVPYTILVQAFMEIVAREDGKGTKVVSATQELYVTRAFELIKEMRGKDILPNKLTYKPIMSWLAAKGNVGQFQELRKLMEDDGVSFDGVFKYYEIQLFLQSRDFERAKSLYLAAKKLDQKLPSSLDSRFLTALAKEDNISVVVDLLPKVIPTIKSSASVVTAMQCLGRHFQRDAALQAFSLLKTKGTSDQQMTFYLNAYIQGFSQAGKLADAINAFRELEIVSQVKGGQHLFNILIDFCCKQGKISQGLDFLDEMQVRNLELSSFSFNPFIREFGRWTMIDEAFEMKAAMLRLGVQPTVVTYNSLISACVKIGDLERACSLFPEMKELGVEANTHCYNPLIQGFAMQGRFDRALAVMRSMDAAGVKPDVNTYRLLIFACSLSKDQDKADQLFAEMQEREIRPDESIYTVMIIVYSKCGNVDRGIEMIRSLEKSGETAGIEAKSAILHGLAVTGRLEEALALYAVFKRERLLPHSYAVGTLLAALGKVGDLDKMFELFEDARGDGKWPFMNLRQRAEHLNIRCINSVLACIRHNQLGRAISFLRKVKEEGIADEGVLFDKIFLHISTGGQDENEMRWLDVNDGFLVINAMRELGLRPSRMSLEALLDGCAALNDSQQAHRVLQEMEREGLQLNIFSMIRVFRAYVAGEDEEKALDLLNQMPEEDLKDSDVRLLLVQILQPHYVAAADSPIAAEALETLPRVREKVDELLGGNMIPDTDIVL